MRPIRTIAVFPTLLTLGNLICGFFAIVVAARIDKPVLESWHNSMVGDARNLMLSGWLIFLAMVFDGLDGYVARLARTTSDFGAQLDSLCDVVSFGVAPGFLLVKMCPQFTWSTTRRCGSLRRRSRPARRCGWRGSTSRPPTTTSTCISAACPARRRRR